MSVNIVELIKNYVSPDLIAKAGSFLNESEGNVSNAVSGIIPALLGTVASKATGSEQGAAEVLDTAKGIYNSGVLNNSSSLFGNADLLAKGTSFFKGILGDKANAVIDTIAGFAGIKSSSSGSLISMITPLILGLLGKHAADNNLGASGLANFLGEQKNNITSALPSGLSSLSGLLGLNTISDGLRQTVSNVQDTATSTYNYAENAAQKAGGGAKWLLPLLLLAVIALALWYFLGKGCNHTATATSDSTTTTTIDTTATAPPVPAPTTTVTGKYDSVSGNYIYDVGADKEIKLADGTTLTVGANSTEAKLYDFLTNETVDTADKTKGWITLDRVYFETGKAVLTAESQKQLKNIATILKNFPSAHVKFGGYTDNTGSADVNKKLSGERAKAAANEIVKLGIPAANIASEGYGPDHPICAANDTPECKAQNRRVDLRITEK
ncbi:hypothetical protein A8C56_22145 [Niabella ginsenosidivorans]|uniref:OmpA-like domain-containing protein n=1 Tax=Niabella ginsenosidivorans TaxID=1176587 RepID=A0A1A9I9D9_9BACT|nr:OmpA family protein [Niabella ginsenosidivorans]ANH83322.1 hypothetical protein A8C56_22145 [Niabella ginsenosidivorans]